MYTELTWESRTKPATWAPQKQACLQNVVPKKAYGTRPNYIPEAMPRYRTLTRPLTINMQGAIKDFGILIILALLQHGS